MELQQMDGADGDGEGVLCNSINDVDSTPSTSSCKCCLTNSEPMSPILIFLFFNKAIRNELDELHRLSMDFATARGSDIGPLRERYQFIRSIYKHHSNAEDEVIFPALDVRMKNAAQTHSLEHKGESNIFDLLIELFNSFKPHDESFQREFVSCTWALQKSVSQHMAKEEEHVFPMLIENFSLEEQASLIWQFLCSIPVDKMAELLPWLSSSISSDERQDLHKCLRKVVPQEKLLQKIIFTWMGSKDIANVVGSCVHDSRARVDVVAKKSSHQTHEVNWTRVSTTTGKRKSFYSNPDAFDSIDRHPINGILLWHNAIKNEWNKISQKVEKIKHSVDFTDISAFNERLQFIIEVCIFHSVSKDRVIFPAVDGEFTFLREHAEEKNQFNKFRYLMEKIKNVGENSSSASELYRDLSSHAMLVLNTIERNFDDQEIQVIPLAQKVLSFKKQRELLYQSLCTMPLKLIERVLPWFVGSLTDAEARDFLKNIKLAAPLTDTALVELFSGWAFKARDKRPCWSSKGIDCYYTGNEFMQSICSCASSLVAREKAKTSTIITGSNKQCLSILCARCRGLNASDSVSVSQLFCDDKSCCVSGFGVNTNNLGLSSLVTVKSFRSLSSSFCAPSLNSSLFLWETDDGPSDGGSIGRPIDTIFQFHKAISKDLEYLDVESGKLSNCDEIFLRQFIGRFLLLWGLYRAHSNAEDEIVFPALESKEALHNVSHSYTLDHKQEENLFEDISCVLSELSLLHQNLQGYLLDEDLDRRGLNKNIEKYREQATKLQGMCKSARVTLDQHIFREELELWPLFDIHFSVEEQDKLIGHIIGTTGAEVLQSMLPWVTSALTEEEQNKMMKTWKQATKNTMFNEWLKECWNGSLFSELQTETFEAKFSHKVPEIQSLEQTDQMFKPGWKDIFLMNQNKLESEIHKADHDLTLDPRRKTYLVKNLMTSRWIAAQQKLLQAEGETSNKEDVPGRSPSFRDPERKVFGCEHYKRNCKLLAACCGKLFTCRFCHDNVSDHSMDRKATSEMMCMLCLNVQPVEPICIMPSCNGFSMGKYYCNICKFFDDERSVYHCPFCNLCRVGTGLGIDVFHCMTCNCCLGTKAVNHKCLEKSLEINCPICCDFLFTSSATVKPLPCGHYMHSACFQAYTCSHYTCPICSKSLGDMAVYFGMLDALLSAEELPEEFKNQNQDILCNDCNEKGTSRFHWLHHKCRFCGSYNTRVIKSEKKNADWCSSAQ